MWILEGERKEKAVNDFGCTDTLFVFSEVYSVTTGCYDRSFPCVPPAGVVVFHYGFSYPPIGVFVIE